jgi:hypothetical protein
MVQARTARASCLKRRILPGSFIILRKQFQRYFAAVWLCIFGRNTAHATPSPNGGEHDSAPLSGNIDSDWGLGDWSGKK